MSGRKPTSWKLEVEVRESPGVSVDRTSNNDFISPLKEQPDLRKDSSDSTFCFSLPEESSPSPGWGRIAAQYVHDQWACLSFLLKEPHALLPASEGAPPDPVLPATQTPARTLQAALAALTVLPSDRVLPVFHCMKLLVPQVDSEPWVRE